MFNLFILILIFLENSLITVFPYNLIALPYLTYLAYKKGKSGLIQVILACILISNKGNVFIEIGIIFIFIFIISYYLSKILGYEEVNIIYYTLIQFIIYGSYIYMKFSYVSFRQLFIMLSGYILINYTFIKKARKKL